jgi:hypothetical protein
MLFPLLFFFFFSLGPPLVFKGTWGEAHPTQSNRVVGGEGAILPLSNHGDKVRWLGWPLCSCPRDNRRPWLSCFSSSWW